MKLRLLAALLLAGCPAKPTPSPVDAAPLPPPVVDAAPPADAPPPPGPALAPGGRDFVAEARILYRVAACGGDDAVPPGFDRDLVKRHCSELRKHMDRYRERWLAIATPFLKEIIPTDLPTVVVYPFGGGDLVSALTVFPDLTEVTTLSLEPAGDPRLIDDMKPAVYGPETDEIRNDLRRFYLVAHSRTDNLTIVSKGHLPGQLIFTLAGLVMHDMEPLSLRYFRLTPEGDLVYIDDTDIAKAAKSEKSEAALLNVFANMEITFKARGEDGPIRVFRHIRANLDDPHLAKSPGPLRHLERKGEVTTMTKAASYLLWDRGFKTIRDYLLTHMAFMISDSTGIPLKYTTPAGFEQIPYGTFAGPFLNQRIDKEAQALIDLYAAGKPPRLPFRFGYPDSAKTNHLIITRKTKK